MKPTAEVLILVNALWGGGAEKQMLLMASVLVSKGWKCSVYWLTPLENWNRVAQVLRAIDSGVRFYEPSGKLGDSLEQILKVRYVLASNPSAVLWTWGYRADLLALLLRVSFCANLVVGSLRSAYEERIRRYRLFWRLLARSHAAFFSNTHRNIELVAEVAPQIGRKATVVYNAVEDHWFSRACAVKTKRPDVLRIVMLGNQSAYTKGYDIAIALAERFARDKLPFVVAIGGEPCDLAELRQRVASLGAPVELPGKIEDVPRFLGEAHLFLLLSRYEGTPNALLEAMAMGVPAICTPVGDIPRLAVDGEHLRLIDPAVDAAYQAVRSLWDHWPETIRMGAAGRQLCRHHFSEEAMGAEIARLMAAVVENRNSRETRK